MYAPLCVRARVGLEIGLGLTITLDQLNDQIAKISSTNRYHNLETYVLFATAICSKCSMKIFAKTEERGEPIAAPLVCS